MILLIEAGGMRSSPSLSNKTVLVSASTISALGLGTLVYSSTRWPLLSALAMFGPSIAQVAGASALLSAADRLPPRATMTWLALAVGGTGRVGCDVEVVRERTADDWQALLGADMFERSLDRAQVARTDIDDRDHAMSVPFVEGTAPPIRGSIRVAASQARAHALKMHSIT